MLIEKPSHNSALQAKTFKKMLMEREIDDKRVHVGLHHTLHPSFKVLCEQIECFKDQIDCVSLSFNYPKNPHAKGDRRVYNSDTGGVMKDLGVYVFQHAKEIASKLGVDIFGALRKDENAKLKVKRSKEEQVDVVVDLTLHTKNEAGEEVRFELETAMNPGCIQKEEVVITLKNGDRITQNWYVHPDSSTGVFIEKADGSVVEFPESVSNFSSYD